MSKSDSLFRGKAFLRYHFPNRHSEAKPKNLKSEIPNRHSEAKPKNLKSEILRGVYTERSECAQDDGANLDSYVKKPIANHFHIQIFRIPRNALLYKNTLQRVDFP